MPKRLWIAPAFALIAIVIAGVTIWWFHFRETSFTVNGQLVLMDSKYVGSTWVDSRDNMPCNTSGGYSDITEGAEVRITSDSKLLALGHLSSGQYRLQSGNRQGQQLFYTTGCAFAFTATVPGGHKFYAVEITHRGAINYTLDQLKTPGAVILTLGNGN